MPADLIDCSVGRGARGIVVAGDGNGNMNAATIERAAKAAKAGIVIVRSSRVATGTVSRNVEIDDDRLASSPPTSSIRPRRGFCSCWPS
ncbi:hypothetical protein [Desulfosarcina cetonica]|uniref:hypothetical protein n=1 Tax=Desulfosarcina cetonica TaxID=90730 RepID=UPI001FF0689E|nr:hypothetical protein [Desulfosarcina cetonica]